MVKILRMNEGLRDWWMQRISASLISIFAFPVLTLWFGGWLSKDIDWYLLLSSFYGKGMTFLGLLGFALHSRIGLWVVITDYFPRSIQRGGIWFANLWIAGLFLWGLQLLWIL